MFSILIRFLLQFCFNLLIIIYHHHHHRGRSFLTLTFHMKLGFQPALALWNNDFTNRFLYIFDRFYLLIFLCLLFFFLLLISSQKFFKMWRRFVCVFPGKSIKRYKKINSSKKCSSSSSSSSSSSNSDDYSYDSSCFCSNLGGNPNSNSNQRVSSWDRLESKSKSKSNSRSSSGSSNGDDGFDPLIPFENVVSDGEKRTLFISKLCLCGTVIIDFKKPNTKTTAYQKDLKKLVLLELKDFVASNSSSSTYSEHEIFAVCKMCSANLFRELPPPPHFLGGFSQNDIVDVDDHDVREARYDPAWSHLKLVYDLLLYFITSSSLDAKVAKKYINYTFLLRLFDLFDSEDPRERECLKILLHRIYGKFVAHRPFIRKNISYIFHEYTLGIQKHNGITELLEILGSVIAGFSLPLKTEFKVLLCRVLIPMHKPKTLGLYIQQLTNCMVQYISKEPKLASRVISGMLKFWPKTNSRKEVMFLTELEDIIESIEMAEFQKVMIPLFQRLRRCISSYNFQVAERTMLLWNNEQFVSLVEVNRHVILPIIFPALEHNFQCHWNRVVLNLTFEVRKIFLQMDIPLFNDCHAHYVKEQENLSLAIKNKREKQHRENSAVINEEVVLLTRLKNSVLC